MSWRYSVADLLCGQIQAILILGCLEQISDMKEKDQSIRGSNERASERECRPHADQTGTRRSYENIYICIYGSISRSGINSFLEGYLCQITKKIPEEKFQRKGTNLFYLVLVLNQENTLLFFTISTKTPFSSFLSRSPALCSDQNNSKKTIYKYFLILLTLS